jgi:glycosyltransferase involved in cell wall biosynthesis
VRVAQLVLSGDVAGGQLVALEVARAARARGDEVVFLSPGRGPFTELVELEGMEVRLVDVSRTFRVGGAVRLWRLLRELRVDVLHTHTALAANVLARAAGRLAGVPVVSHLHIENHFRPQALPRAALRWLDNRSARLAARVLAVSEDTKRALVAQGYPPELVEVVPNGVRHVPGSRSHPAGLEVPEGTPLVAEIARLCDVKGQRDLLDALRLVPGVHAVLVGEDLETGGEYRDFLEREARRLGVADRVVLTGYRADVPEILDAVDAVVLPSLVEGMPLVLLEAMAHGRPVVATPVGGTREVVVDGETGLLVPPRDPQALARAIRRLVDDAELASRLGAAGRERVRERFSVEAMTHRVLEVYDEVVCGR